MENVIKQDGYFKIDNAIAEALARINLSEYESRALWVILRKTLGWHKELDIISVTQFEKATGVNRGNLHPALQRLALKKIIIISRLGRKCSYKFNQNVDEWINKKRVMSRKNIVATNNIVSKQNTSVSSNTTKSLFPNTNTKEELNTTKQNTFNSGSAAGVPPTIISSRQPTPVQLLVASYKKLYVQKFGTEPSIGNSSWGKYGRLLKSKLEQGHPLEEIIELLRIFAASKDSRAENLGFGLEVFLSDFVFNKMKALKSQTKSADKLEEKYGKWK